MYTALYIAARMAASSVQRSRADYARRCVFFDRFLLLLMARGDRCLLKMLSAQIGLGRFLDTLVGQWGQV